ncbi:MAG: FHA domain-containing protein [Bacteroidales bacterium]|nr:FHA domain-containing protein [Bacteroidales bacterium]
MKLKLYIIFGFVLSIILSAIFPLTYHYANKNIPPIPKHHTYQNAVMHTLPDSIQAKAKRNKCRKYIIPVNSVQGKSDFYPSLKEDINLALASYTRWELIVSEQEKSAMKQRHEKTINLWGVFIPDIIPLTAMVQSRIARNTKYSAQAQLIKLSENNGDNQKLIVKVNDELKQSLVFKIEVNFVHPDTLKMWQKTQKLQEKHLSALKKRADLSMYFLKGFIFLLLVYIAILIMLFYYNKLKQKKYAEYLLIEIQKCEQLADKGHFVTAMQLAEKYLKVFPDDTDIISFKERLLDFTNNDPKRAQIAFVEAQKLKMRINMAENNPMQTFLSPGEKERLAPLLPYYPQLKESYLVLVSNEEQVNKNEEFHTQIKKLKKLLLAGKIAEAENIFEQIEIDTDNNIQLEDINNKIKQKKEKAEQDYAQIQQNLIKGEIINVRKKLKDILQSFKDMPQALSLQRDIIQAERKTQFVLYPQYKGKNINIYCGNNFTLGREDENIHPDIIFNDKRISRKHASVFIDNKQLFVENLNSTGGTYVNGKKISRQSLKNGDVLTLAKIIDLKISIFITKDGKLGGVLLSGMTIDYIIIVSYIQTGFRNEKLCIKPDNFSFYYNDNIALFSTKKAGFILKQDELIKLNDYKYIVEVKNEKVTD